MVNGARGARAAAILLSLAGGSAAATEEPTMDERIRQIVEGPLVVAVEGEEPAEVRRGVRYTAEGDIGPALDLYLPPAGAERRGAWIFVHGGPLPPGMNGGLRQPREWRFFRDYGALAAAAGRVGVVLGHRFSGLDAVDRSAADLRAGIDWVRQHADELEVDAERLALWLYSGAGVHLPTLVAAPPAGVRSIVAFYPVVEVAALAAMGMGQAPEGAAAPPPVVDAAQAPRLFVARAGLDHPALNAALDRFVASALSAGLTLELANHASGHHGFELLDDDARSREIVESALRFLVRGESESEPVPRVVRPPTLP